MIRYIVGVVVVSCAAQAVAITAPDLRSARSFSILAGTRIENSGTTRVTGDIGAGSGSTPEFDHVAGEPRPAGDALKDAAAAANALAAPPCDTNPTALSGTLVRGVYCMAAADLAGVLTFDAAGDADAVWVIRINTTLTTHSESSMRLLRGAQSSNIFWLTGEGATLGEHSAFAGTLIATTSISVLDGVTVSGRLLARQGSVTLANDDINLCCDPIALSALPAGVVNQPYSATIVPDGGTAPHEFSFFTEDHPQWLHLDLDGTLSGTPPAAGRAMFVVMVKDFKGCTSIRTYDITICGIPTPNPRSLPDAVVGSAYSALITSDTPVLFSSANLPDGLTLTPATCTTVAILCGTPTKPGIYKLTVTTTGCDGVCSGSRDYIIEVRRPIITVLPETLEGGTVGVAYEKVITANGSLEPYRFEASPSTPPGVIVAPSGVLSFTPSVAGKYSFFVTATDSYGSSGMHNYTIDVCPLIAVTPAVLLDGMVNVFYSAQLGGPYTFTATQLPEWLTLTNGLLSGTPRVAGDYPITITAMTAGCSAEVHYKVHVADCPPIIFSPTTLTRGTLFVPYNQTISITATPPYTVQVTGSIPPGLSPPLTLSGVPSVAGIYRFTIIVTDACRTASQTYTIAIEPAAAPGAIIPTLSPWAALMLIAILCVAIVRRTS